MNNVSLVGFLIGGFAQNHMCHGKRYYEGKVEVERTSGNVDTLRIIVPEHLVIDRLNDYDGALVRADGEIHSRNVDFKTELFVCVRNIEIVYGSERINEVELYGTICKPPRNRTTPNGSVITDCLIAVNRHSGRPDYIPCIAWDENAYILEKMEKYDELHIKGRFQSRNYAKKTPDGNTEYRTTYEMSISEII